MAVAYDATGVGSAANSDSLTFNHTTGAGFDIVLVVCVATPNSVSTVTWNSTSLTQIRQDVNAGYGQTEIWYLTGAVPATSANVVVSLNGGMAQNKAQSMSFTGGTTPTDATGSNADAATSVSDTVLNAGTDDFVFDALYIGDASPTVGANQTAFAAVTGGGNSLHGSRQDGADGGVMSWTFASSDQAHSAVRIPAAAVAATSPVPGARRLMIDTNTLLRR